MRVSDLKRTFRASLAAALLVVAGSASANIAGDLNGDGKVNVGDATLALQISVGLVTATPDQLIAGDVSPSANGVYGDKKIGVGDAIRLLRYSVGLETTDSFPGGTSINVSTPPQTQGVPLPTVFTNLAISDSTTHDFQLPGGFKIQGKLNGTKDPRITDESLTFAGDKGGAQPLAAIVTSDAIKDDNAYLVGVPAGTYRVYYKATVHFESQSVPTTGGPTTSDIPCIPKDIYDQIPPAQQGMYTVCADTTTGGTGTTTGTTGTTGGTTSGTPGEFCVPQSVYDQIPPADRDGITVCADTTGTTAGDNGLVHGGPRPQQIPGAGASSDTEITLAVGTVQISADTTHDFARPVLPTLFKVQGKLIVTGKNVQAPYQLEIDTVRSTNPQDIFASIEGASTSQDAQDGTYEVYLPAGSYSSTIQATDTTDFTRDTTAPATPNFTVTGDLSLDLSAAIPDPATNVTLSGTVTLNGAAFPYTFGSVSASSDDTKLVDPSKSSTLTQGKYTMKVEPSTYKVKISFPEVTGTGTGGFGSNWSFAAGSVNVPADTTFDINVPTLPGKVAFTGHILGPDGLPAKGFVVFSATQVNGIAGLTYSTNLSEDKLGADGSYSVTLPPGVYQVYIQPDPGFPVATDYSVLTGVLPGITG